MQHPKDEFIPTPTADVGRRRVLQALGAATVAGLPTWSFGQPTAQVNTTGKAITDTEVTVAAGSTEALSSTLRAVCNPGDGLIIFQPFHEMYPNQANIFGLKPIYVTLRENLEAMQWDLDREELARAAPNARAIILNTPHNPTGKVFSAEELAFIADLCQKHDLFLITDEIYEHILYGNHRHICPATLPGMADRTFVINSISKKVNFINLITCTS